ncbi:TetR/AcrR family transcriptional regulator [uncultured Robinsoniella sp.]|uniref:TetR/AcrR family transcriptional regulator n=1 Tax=uncultured Robinsoniella sp. TaxID=904190 RepID=UPI00374F9999
MAKRNTKELILQEALRLFSDHGYDGVSVRQISGAVGIRESALYRHFKNKQDIFDTIIKRIEGQYAIVAREYNIPDGDLSQVANAYIKNGLHPLKEMTKSMFLFWLKSEEASKFRRMLTIEQFKSSRAGQTYHMFFFSLPLEFQTQLFSEMIKKKYFKELDPKILALNFYSPIFLLINQYDNHPELEEEALQLLEKHIDQFELLYCTPHGKEM